jgi:hypothetical protein
MNTLLWMDTLWLLLLIPRPAPKKVNVDMRNIVICLFPPIVDAPLDHRSNPIGIGIELLWDYSPC